MMAHEISLEQAEVICRMMEVYHNKMDCTEIEALSSLLRTLTGDVCAWLIEEQAIKNNK
ncbi:hypothetical protein AI2669V1_1172 [Klebsiella pneumoniae]|uniref:hypothetical protein n=1 Tax=Klebsiella pneumoniae TaxID=573 RepID=UPI000E2BD09A|nr:hypothetical protein [Klebsiella pneumoniae]MCB7570536.1 hypothetical protein [Klebsiella pneumoniae]MCB7682964.1 hypothetical protein [Klebsiella pneumoniae]MCB7692617.1 hypothetical protein [Klebsiella pneumoniae]MCB7705331.1 hypothetical protein [Klebsiella pneumoniae]MCB7716258.1 hypothetical protein [Klebsiella pneumoniae]